MLSDKDRQALDAVQALFSKPPAPFPAGGAIRFIVAYDPVSRRWYRRIDPVVASGMARGGYDPRAWATEYERSLRADGLWPSHIDLPPIDETAGGG